MAAALLHEPLFARAAARPDEPFLVERGRTTGAGEMAGRVAALARTLAGLGVGPGDRVALWLPRSRETVEALLAASLRGAAALLLNPEWTPAMAARALRVAPAEVLLSTVRAARRLRERADLPPPRAVVAPDGPPGRPWPERPDPRPPPAAGGRPGEAAALLAVAGGEGRTLAAVFRHEALLAGAAAFARLLDLGPGDRVLYSGSLASGCGLEHFTAALFAGSALVLETSPMTADLVDTVAASGVTVLPGRPEAFRDLLAALKHRPEPLPRLRAAVCAGAALPPPLVERLLAHLPGAALHLTYGLTEGQRVAAVPPGRLPRAGGALGVPLPGVEVLLADGRGAVCPPGAEGEIALRGPQLFSGYFGDAEATSRRLRPVAGGAPEWTAGGEARGTAEGAARGTASGEARGTAEGAPALFTGDLARREGDLLVLTGRRAAMLRCGGERVDGAEVREALLACDLLSDAEVSGGTDPDGLDRVVAAVAFRPGVPADLPAVRAHLRRRLPPFMLPHLVTRTGSDPKPPRRDGPDRARGVDGPPAGAGGSGSDPTLPS